MRKFVAILLVAVAAYAGSAGWGAWRLREALKSRDLGALEARVDWPQLRANLKPRVERMLDSEAQKYGTAGDLLRKALQGRVTNTAVDALVTPAWLARALKGREVLIGRTPMPQSGRNDPGVDDLEIADDPMPPRRLRWAFFDSLTRFRVEAVHPRLENGRIVALLELQGLEWKLVDIDVTGR